MTAKTHATADGASETREDSAPTIAGDATALNESAMTATPGDGIEANGATGTRDETLATNDAIAAQNGATVVTDDATVATNDAMLATNGATLATNGATLATNGASLATNGALAVN